MYEVKNQSMERNTPPCQFGELNREDVEALILESQYAFLASAKNPNEITEDLFAKFESDPNFAIYGYEVDSQAISYIVALSHPSSDTIAIGPMYVSKQFRGQGFGKSQVCDFIEAYKVKGFHSFYAKTWDGNQASKVTFEQLGFEVVERREDDRSNGDATIIYLLNAQ